MEDSKNFDNNDFFWVLLHEGPLTFIDNDSNYMFPEIFDPDNLKSLDSSDNVIVNVKDLDKYDKLCLK